MSVGQTYINIQLLCQKFFQLPLLYDTTTSYIRVNPKLQKGKPWKLPVWNLQKCFIMFFSLVVPAYHLYRLWRKQVASTSGEEVAIQVGFIAASAFYTSSWYAIDSYEVSSHDLASWVTGTFLLQRKVTYRGWPWPLSTRIPELPEIIGYGLSLGIMLLTVVTFPFPFLKSYDPASILISIALPHLPTLFRQVIAAFVCTVLVIFGVATALPVLLLTLTACSLIESSSKENLHLSITGGIRKHSEKDWAYKSIEAIRNIFISRKINGSKPFKVVVAPYASEIALFKSKRVSDSANFRQRLQCHYQIYLLVAASIPYVIIYIPTLAGVGLTLGTVTAFCAIKFYDSFELIFYVASCAIFVAVIALTLFFCHHSPTPALHTEEFIRFWEGNKNINKIERRQAKALMPYGFALGPFFKTTRCTALNLIDCNLVNTVNLLVA